MNINCIYLIYNFLCINYKFNLNSIIWDPLLAPTNIPLNVFLIGLLQLFNSKPLSILEQFLAIDGA